MAGFEENEISLKANGGTELIKRRLGGLLDPTLLDNFQIISSRIRELNPEKIRVMWSHDLPEDPESEKIKHKAYRDKFHKFVFVSNWQYNRYQLFSGLPYDTTSIIIEHGIVPSPASCLNKPNDKIRLVYTSTPQRGLELLVPVFKRLAEKYPNIHLDVFSSFKIYGFDEADKRYEPLYEECRNHPQITYHGFTPNDELRAHVDKCHIFAYPSIWMETACIALMEAMSAGLVCVHPNFGALADTSGGLNMMYHGNFNDRNSHANILYSYLEGAIELVKSNKSAELVGYAKFYADNRFHINRAMQQWENLLKTLLNDYPTIESRFIAEEKFVYRTT